MNVQRIFCAALVTCAGLFGTASAALIDRGSGLIYDEVLNVTWLQDANYAKTSGYDDDGQMTWHEALSWADSLVYEGYDDWYIPSYTGPTNGIGWYGPSDTDFLVHLFYNELGNQRWHPTTGGGLTNTSPFVNFEGGAYWTSTPSDFDYGVGLLTAWWFDKDGYYIPGGQMNQISTLVFRYGDSSPASVPEPATYALMLAGLGLIGLVATRRRL